MGPVALDASVLIALLEPTDPHNDRARALLQSHASERRQFILAASAFAEALVGPLRRGADELVEGFIDDSGTLVIDIGRSIARRAAALRVEHRSLRLGDALVLATAREHDAELLTFDEKLRRIAAR